jgi:3-deoxy-D-manno-octulosonate 8-phosphate phosphatase (KDO 8-P phosphatase)
MIDPAIARQIKLIGLDVDGVMTDAGVYLGTVDGGAVELKRFDIQDNVGIRLLREENIPVAIVSGRASPATTARAKELGITDLYQDHGAHKLGPFEEILARHGIGWDEAAYLGDDLPDLTLLARVGLPVCVANAMPDVQAVAHHITEARGGRGAIREFVESFFRARGEWDAVVQRYVDSRGGLPEVTHAS